MEVRRGAGGEAGRVEADDPQLHGEVGQITHCQNSWF